jgi:hypothetical protein
MAAEFEPITITFSWSPWAQAVTSSHAPRERLVPRFKAFTASTEQELHEGLRASGANYSEEERIAHVKWIMSNV